MTPRASADKRELAVTTDDQGSPSKTPKISSVCFGIGSADKAGEVTKKVQEDELKTMAAEYLKAIETGECFVHLRPKHSSNRDLKMLTQLTGCDKFRKVNFEGSEVESVITNSNHLAEVLTKSKCTSRETVEQMLEAEVKSGDWESDMRGFEQHVEEEGRVRVDWANGKFENHHLQCPTCGDKNVWDRVHACCQDVCKETLNALQAFPLAAWDDISSVPLDPEKVIAARKLEIAYVEAKPVWEKISRKLAKEQGWKIVRSRWIDINKGDELHPNYRSRMVGKEFNDSELDGLFAATPPLEALRLLLSWAATDGSAHPGGTGQGRMQKILLIADVSRAVQLEKPGKTPWVSSRVACTAHAMRP